jgi:hypothetical protein
MKGISVYIQLNNITLQFCESFVVESSWDTFTDTASIVVPNVIFKAETSNATVGLDTLFQKGDPVEIRAGYNKAPDNLETIFKGFISKVKTGTLLEITCEDSMYALKQKNLTSKSFVKPTLKELIDYLVEDITIDTKLIDDSVVLGNWVIENNSFINPVQVLKKLKSDYGFVSYIKDGVLNVGVPYDATGKTHYLLRELNIIDDDLKNEANDTLRVLKGISILPDNTKIIKYAVKVNEVITVGDSEVQGELRTLNYYNQTADELTETLKKVYQTTNFTGLQGSFTTFGEPVIKYNDWIKLRDLKNPERDGVYKVNKVVTEMTTGGGLRQNITIDFGQTEIEANE